MALPNSIEELTIAEVHAGYQAKQFTARELVQAYLDRIDAIDKSGPTLNSIISVSSKALDEADKLDKFLAENGTLKGSLHGVPVVLKDQIETADIPTSFGSSASGNYLPKSDATVVIRLKEAGAIILGKTTMPDFATSWFSTSSKSGTTKNPYALDHDTGGSSSGSAAAVAANLALVGVGEDTGGSIRLPASFCNLVGVRVSPGLISRTGMSSLVTPQDTSGPMCRTVTDAATLLDAMVGYDSADPYTSAFVVGGRETGYAKSLEGASLSGKRIGVLRQAFGEKDDPDGEALNKVLDKTLKTMQEAGAVLVDVEIPDLDHFVAFTSVYLTRSLQDMNAFVAARPDLGVESIEKLYETKQYHEKLDLLEAIATGPKGASEDPEYANRMLAQTEFQRLVIRIMVENDLDVFAFPDVRLPAPSNKDIMDDRWTCLTYPTNTVIASQLHFPAVTVPVGFTESGLPVGLELMGIPYGEKELLHAARGLEMITGARMAPSLGGR
jgi:Asp-tRNA(Asn)/Glu-tRNA(Gln) amidotransferase A subunit family amidase